MKRVAAPDSSQKRIYASTNLLLRRNGIPLASVLAVQMVIYEKTVTLRADFGGRTAVQAHLR